MNFRKIAGFLKLEHTLFSLPMLFAGAAIALAEDGKKFWDLGWAKAFLIVVAGTGARTCALALNRLLDRKLDAQNPRTAGRELPSGKLSTRQAWLIALAGLVLYGIAAGFLGAWCLYLAPLPIAIFTIYPLMKRFTFLAHWGVGAGLALAPLGGYVGAVNRFPMQAPVWLLAGFTLCWVAGFDLIYATQDETFDRQHGLYSVPSRFGAKAAIRCAAAMHAAAFLFLLGTFGSAFLAHPKGAALGLAPLGLLLAAEQKLGASLEPNAAFFKVNAWIGVFALVFVLLGTGQFN